MSDKKAIIFGINGMDAKTVAHLLLDKKYQVVGTYRRNTLSIKHDIHSLYDFNQDISFEYCDINDFNSIKVLLNKHKDVTEIYLLAAQSHVGFSFESPSVSSANGYSVYNVLENVKNICPKSKLYFAATSELFGGNNPQESYNENSPFDPRSPYSIYKEVGTRWIKFYRHMGIFACYGLLFNHSNIYRSEDFFIRRVTKSAARIATGKQKELVLGNLDFYRDEHWSDFGCEMMWKMLQNEEPKDYVIATGKTWHGLEYLQRSFDYFNLKWEDYVKIDKSRFRPNEVVKLIGDSRLAQLELGWNPNRMSFAEHIKEMCFYDFEIETGNTPKRKNYLELYK